MALCFRQYDSTDSQSKKQWQRRKAYGFDEQPLASVDRSRFYQIVVHAINWEQESLKPKHDIMSLKYSLPNIEHLELEMCILLVGNHMHADIDGIRNPYIACIDKHTLIHLHICEYLSAYSLLQKI